jgi:hypothetical protein
MNMTLSLAQMLISKGIRVNAVLPGSTWTPLIVTAVDAEGQKQEGVAPIGRPAQPAELAPSYVMLASDERATSPAPCSPSAAGSRCSRTLAARDWMHNGEHQGEVAVVRSSSVSRASAGQTA